jgi:Ca2+-binding RTX toxin-like protein
MENKMSANPLATDGNDQINGTIVPDYFDASLGNDTVFGGGGGDFILGNEGNDTLYADTYAGFAGADTSKDYNILLGGTGDDTLVSGVGWDDLWGGTGNDVMTGGANMDWFVFEPSSGVDTITDFTAGEDQIIVMANMNGVGELALSQNGNGTVVDFGGGNAVLLTGVEMSSLPTNAIQVQPYTDVDSFYSLTLWG